MRNGDLQALMARFELFLTTQLRLSPVAMRRDRNIVKRCLKENVLASRDSFVKYCLNRLENGITAATINKDIAAVKKWLKFNNMEWEKISYFKTEKHNIPSPTVQEIEQFRAVHTTDAMDLFWDLHITCGTRPSEVLNLKVKDIDMENSCFYPEHTKTNDGLPIIILPNIKPKLQKYIENLPTNNSYLFGSSVKRNRPLTIAAIGKDCRKRLEAINCKKPYTPYSFRHAYITIGLANGVPVQYIQRSARHTNIKTTMEYLDKSVDFAKMAAYSHPYYKSLMSAEQIVSDCVNYIKKMVDVRFDDRKLNQVYSMLYDSAIIGI